MLQIFIPNPIDMLAVSIQFCSCRDKLRKERLVLQDLNKENINEPVERYKN
jgi:hypothetical protein